MAPKAAEKKPSTTGGKAPAGKAPAEKKEAGKKTAAPSGDKKKRNKARKETYSSYIYKGLSRTAILLGMGESGQRNHRSGITMVVLCSISRIDFVMLIHFQCSSRFILTLVSRTVPCPSSTHSSMVNHLSCHVRNVFANL